MKSLVLQRINELIDSYKLSKNAFANKINMEQTTVNNQLIGKRGVSIDLILNILLAFSRNLIGMATTWERQYANRRE